MKKCSSCKQEKDVNEFGVKSSTKDKLNPRCKDCYSSYMKKWYSENSLVHKSRVYRRKNEIKKKMWDYYMSHPCVDCGESNPIVLHADHVGTKTDNVSSMVYSGKSWNSILKELKNCEIRCANCHAIKTAKDFGWYNSIAGYGGPLASGTSSMSYKHVP